jgi:hypothetical protein
MSQVFISYAHHDISSAQRIANDFRNAGYDVWFDKDSLQPGQHWDMEIKNAIKESDYFIALLSTKSMNKRGYVHSEILQALSVLDEVPPNQIFLIPARLDNCKIFHPRLNQLQWVDMFPDWNTTVRRIIQAMG